MTSFTPSAEQTTIIEYPAIPVRIAAGAGTGKTTTIVHRLSRLVGQGLDPARALGITFTNKAADELRSKLADTIPDRTDGREVEVATYHGFAASILDEFGARIGYSPGLTLIDEGQRSELAMNAVRAHRGLHLDLTSLPQRRDEMLMLASNMRDNLATPSTVRSHAPATPDDTWTTRLAIVDIVESFEATKRDLGLLEYGDLMRLAFAIIDAEPDIAADIRSRYDAVLLDEYQDTDPIQRKLLSALFATGMPITAVGDTDQTIYEWRGASIDNFEDFPTDFPDADGSQAETLPLSINRRSDESIIDIANNVRTKLPKVTGSGRLIARQGAAKGTVTTGWFRTESDEANWIADHIIEGQASGTPFADIAVLCRKRDGMRPIADALRAAGVPYSVGSMGELLEVPEVADLLAWLAIIANPSDEPALLRVLMGGRYRLGMGDIATLNRALPASGEETLIDVATRDVPVADLAPSSQAAITSFAATFAELFVASQALTVTATLALILDRLDYWAEVAALPSARAITTRINVSRFIDLADQWRPLEGPPTLAGYLRYLDALNESGRADELDAAEVPADDAVRIVTVHGAKGLEWSHVYIPALSAKIFPSDVQRYYDPSNTPVALPYDMRLDAQSMAAIHSESDPKERKRLIKIRHDNQEWRLAYVAVTRAKHQLVMSGHAWHADNLTPKEPSELLTLAMDMASSERGPTIDEPGARPDPAPFVDVAPAPDPLFNDGWASAIRSTVDDEHWVADHFPEVADAIEVRRRQLAMTFADLREPTVESQTQTFSTSVTNLVAMAECPLKFKWIHHDRLPRKPRASATRGTAFHRKAELHNLGVAALDDMDTVSYDEVDERYETGPGTKAADPWATFTSSRFFEPSPFLVETPFEITLDGRRLRGKIDAVYGDGDRWEIVDYKSGGPSPSAAKMVQLQAYAIAAANGAVSAQPPEGIDVTFAFFGVSPAVEVKRRADEQWLNESHDRVESLLRQAENGPFPPEPSKACRWCDFLHHCETGRAFLEQAENP